MELRHVETAALDLSLVRLRQVPEVAVRDKMASLREKGQLSPLVAADQGGVLVLVDGFVRHRAAQRLGLEHVLVEVVAVDVVQMKAQLYLRNRDRAMGLFEQCRLVRELVEAHGLSQVEVATLLECHKSWVCRRLALARMISPHVWEEVALGLVSDGGLRKLAELHVRNQEEVVAVSRREELRPREVALLVDLWRRAPDAQARDYLAAQPRKAIERSRNAPDDAADARLGQAASEIVRGLGILRQVAVRIELRMRGGIGEPAAEGVVELRKAHKRAEEGCTAALGACQWWLRSRPEVAS